MRFADKVSIITQSKVSDGMGGWVLSDASTVSIFCHIATLDAVKATKDYGIELKNPLKLFTREHIPELSTGFKLTVNGADYAVKSASTNQLIKAYLLEKMP